MLSQIFVSRSKRQENLALNLASPWGARIFSFGGWGQDDHTPRERLGLVSLTQPNMADGLGFARKQLEKHGWSEGKITCLSNENEIFTNKAVNEGRSKFVP